MSIFDFGKIRMKGDSSFEDENPRPVSMGTEKTTNSPEKTPNSISLKAEKTDLEEKIKAIESALDFLDEDGRKIAEKGIREAEARIAEINEAIAPKKSPIDAALEVAETAKAAEASKKKEAAANKAAEQIVSNIETKDESLTKALAMAFAKKAVDDARKGDDETNSVRFVRDLLKMLKKLGMENPENKKIIEDFYD